MSFCVKLYPGDEYKGGPLPNTVLGKRIQDIIKNHLSYYQKLSVMFRTLMQDKTDKLFGQYKTQGKISYLSGACRGGSMLYEAKHPINRKSGGVLRVYFCLSKNVIPRELVILDAEYKTGDPDYSTACERLKVYRRKHDVR